MVALIYQPNQLFGYVSVASPLTSAAQGLHTHTCALHCLDRSLSIQLDIVQDNASSCTEHLIVAPYEIRDRRFSISADITNMAILKIGVSSNSGTQQQRACMPTCPQNDGPLHCALAQRCYVSRNTRSPVLRIPSYLRMRAKV